MGQINVKGTLKDMAAAKAVEAHSTQDNSAAESLQLQATCLSHVADNASGVANEPSEERKSKIIDTVAIECAKWTPHDKATDFDGGSTWVRAMLKIQKQEILESKRVTIFDGFWDMITAE